MIYSNENLSKESVLINELSPKVFLFYKNFIYESSENSLLILSHYIFNDLTKIPINFGEENFLLFHLCLENISKNYIENILNNSEHYLKNLYNYLKYLYEKKYEKINDCLLIFLKCFYLLALKIKSADYEILISLIKKILIEINILFNIATKYFKYDEENSSNFSKKPNKEIKNKNQENSNVEIENGLKSSFKENMDNEEKDKTNINVLEQCLIIDLQLINDFFDFEITEHKEMISKLIDVYKVINSLKYQNISHLSLRTQMIRYVRKVLIDMNYNKDSNYIYVNSIINNQDNLSILKISPLIKNYKYPTKLLSYAKDFWNLSIKSKANKNIIKSSSRIAEELTDEKNIENNEDKNESGFDPPFYNTKNIEDEKNNTNVNSKINLLLQRGITTIKKDLNQVEELNSKELKTFKNSFLSNLDDYNQKESLKSFDSNVYELLINELSNVNDILSEINTSLTDEMQTLGEYFQNGLLIPIIFFFKKSFALAHNLSGSELVKLYDLAIQTITLKITISEFKYNFWENNINNSYGNNFEEDLFSIHFINNKKDILINGDNFIGGEIIKTCNQSLKALKSKNFTCFDYTLLYNIVEKNLFSLIKEYSKNSLGELFSEKEDDISLQILRSPYSKNSNNSQDTNEKLYKIYLLYKNNKNFFEENNSSLFSILPEICIEYETNFRNLLIFTLISISVNPSLNTEDYSLSSLFYFLLFKLLSLQTSKTQSEIMSLLGGNGTNNNNENNLGFMATYSNNLLKRIILIFIEEFNPKDKYYDENYMFAIILIKIFKFLCEEHNNYFQGKLIKILSYQYRSIVPTFYNENKSFNEFKNQYGDSVIFNFNFDFNEEKEKIKYIKFFDFYLFVLLKITLISGWNELKDLKSHSLNKNILQNSHNENENIYDLFTSIIEMLNEIIQGNKEENLNKLGNPFFKDDDNLSSDEEKEYKDLISMEINFLNGGREIGDKKVENYQMKKKIYQKLRIEKDPFTCFLREMIQFIFIDNNNSQILYQLRNDLMLFFTSILEEKNCNEEVQKLIMKYLNVHRIFNCISVILKNYFLANCPLDTLPPDFLPVKAKSNTNPPSYTLDYNLSQKNSTIDNNKEKLSNTMTTNEVQKNTNNEKKNNILKEEIIFDHRLLNYYFVHYYSNKDFFISNEFQLANAFYKYIKLISVLGKSEEIKTIIEEVESTGISKAIKKFEPNLKNIKKGEKIDFSNFKDIKNQIRLSKSLQKRKIINEDKIKNKNFSEKNRVKTREEGVRNDKILKFTRRTKKKSFMTSFYTNKDFMKKFHLDEKEKDNNEQFPKNKNYKIFKNKNIDFSDSSERVLGFEKQNESSIKKIDMNSNINKYINDNNSDKNENNKKTDIKGRNKRITFAEIKYENPNKSDNKDITMNMSEKINFNNSTNKNLNKDSNPTNQNNQNVIPLKNTRSRLSVFFKMKEKKGEKISLIPDNATEIYDKEYIERFYIVKFFESITSTIEVKTEDSTNQTVIFTHLPEMIYLSNGTKAEFEQKVNRESETSKKNDLVRHLAYFQKEIEYYKNDSSSLSHWVSKIDFIYVKWASYLYALVLNLITLFTIVGDNILSPTNDNSYDIIKNRRNDEDGIQKKIDLSINKWHKLYSILNYIYLGLNGILIFIWIYFRLPLYFELDKIKFFEENTNKKTLKFWDKLYIFVVMTIINRNYITSLIYSFCISLVCCVLKEGEIIFPFLLLAIVDLNVTLKNVILSIQLRHKEFTRAFFLAFIFMYAMSNIAFFFFNSDYEQEIEYQDDNVCFTLTFCVLNALDSGLRARGGIGDSGKRISFMRHKGHYIKRLILDDIFFLLVVIIAIDLVFGIIIGEFDALRGKEQKHEADRLYHCFICHVNKNTLEKNRQNFYVHVCKEHNMWNYVSYMIFVKLSNIHDLNSINSYTREKIDNKDISWLPSYKDLINSDNENDKEEEINENEDFRIEDENVNNHYVVKPT